MRLLPVYSVLVSLMSVLQINRNRLRRKEIVAETIRGPDPSDVTSGAGDWSLAKRQAFFEYALLAWLGGPVLNLPSRC